MREGTAFECRFEVRWADLDGNRHVRNTAFSEYATHTRFRLLADSTRRASRRCASVP
jgi:acyl-CoA thioesterase FadM